VLFLIDGYNLMHAVGAVPLGRARSSFDAARKRFLDWLADSPQVRLGTHSIRVVFDAQNSTRDLGSTTHRGLLVTYSFRQTADDLIEALIRTEPNPQALRMVSNDTRVRDYARRHKCQLMTCGEFVDWLAERPAANPDRSAEGDEKTPSTPKELDELMKVFGKKPS
jgi:predicted RNA-binding protein with PIN domain